VRIAGTITLTGINMNKKSGPRCYVCGSPSTGELLAYKDNGNYFFYCAEHSHEAKLQRQQSLPESRPCIEYESPQMEGIESVQGIPRKTDHVATKTQRRQANRSGLRTQNL